MSSPSGKKKIHIFSIHYYPQPDPFFSDRYGNTNEHVSSALSLSNDPANAALIAKIQPVWGVNAEGELNGLYTHHALGVPGFWYMLGNLAMCRFHSSHVALQIKAMEEGVWDGVYQG